MWKTNQCAKITHNWRDKWFYVNHWPWMWGVWRNNSSFLPRRLLTPPSSRCHYSRRSPLPFHSAPPPSLKAPRKGVRFEGCTEALTSLQTARVSTSLLGEINQTSLQSPTSTTSQVYPSSFPCWAQLIKVSGQTVEDALHSNLKMKKFDYIPHMVRWNVATVWLLLKVSIWAPPPLGGLFFSGRRKKRGRDAACCRLPSEPTSFCD